MDLQHGIRLIFPQTGPPYRQVLGCISVRLNSPIAPSSDRPKGSGRRTSVEYAGKHFLDIGTPSSLTRSKVSQHFGPCFAPRSNSQQPASARKSPTKEQEIKYPGIVFHVDDDAGDVVEGFTLVPMGLEGSEVARRVVEKLRNGGNGEWGVWDEEVRGPEGTITHCEIHVRLSSSSWTLVLHR